MAQTPEALAFFEQLSTAANLNEALKPSIDDEAELRRLFATERDHARLQDPYVGLVNVFDAPKNARITQARVVKDETDLSERYVMPVAEDQRRATGSPSTVDDLDEFKKNWSIFSEGSLSQLLDWNNVVAAGGSVLACLTPLAKEQKESKRSIRKFYHTVAFPTSDVDLFIWGLDHDQAEAKIVQIYEAVRDSIPWDVTCVRTKHTVSIHSQYPYRSVQIVLRLYKSPAEILAGFDIDAPCCAYDGTNVWANPRSLVSMIRQCNTVDMTRRSPSYEVRLAKYAARGFEVYVPNLDRSAIDPTIFERSIASVEGLARLLAFEKLRTTDSRTIFLENRRQLRGRPDRFGYSSGGTKRKFKGDLKAEAIGGLEMNDYDVATLHIPYGPGWHSRRIEKLVYQTDLGMNSTFNPKNKTRRLHRHPAFFGTATEALDDCCEFCPTPIDDDERKLQEEEDKHYIRGRVSFLEDDPGRQSMTGSFNPIDVGEWSGQVYVGPVQALFAHIASGDRVAVQAQIAQEGYDVNRRDHVGRTALHMAIMCKMEDIACDLIDAGARMTARLVDGKTALHTAAYHALPQVTRKILERSQANKEAVEKEGKVAPDDDDNESDKKPERERDSSEDDWSSADDGVISMEEDADAEGGDDDIEMEDTEDEEENDEDEDEDEDEENTNASKPPDTPPNDGPNIPEDDDTEPDIVDINLPDWDLTFTPLSYAIVLGTVELVDILIAAGADVKLATKSKYKPAPNVHPLSLTAMREDEDISCEIATSLVKAGASSAYASKELKTIFMSLIEADRIKVVSTLLRVDPKAKSVINFPAIDSQDLIFPIVAAITYSSYAMVATLLAHGAKYQLKEEDLMHNSILDKLNGMWFMNDRKPISLVLHPVETAICHRDDIIHLLVDLGADINLGILNAFGSYVSAEHKVTYLEWTSLALKDIQAKFAEQRKAIDDIQKVENEISAGDTGRAWSHCLTELLRDLYKSMVNKPEFSSEKVKLEQMREYYQQTRTLLKQNGAKTWDQVYGKADGSVAGSDMDEEEEEVQDSNIKYLRHKQYYSDNIIHMLSPLYDELYEACYAGDDAKIKELCLPSDSSRKRTLLQISVEVQGAKFGMHSSGITPLFAAMYGRKWQTAKLVMNIAITQFKPEEKKSAWIAPSFDMYGDGNGDMDVDDGDSVASDETIDAAHPELLDMSENATSVRTEASPLKMLHECTFQFQTLLQRAIAQDDLESYSAVMDLYSLIPESEHFNHENTMLEFLKFGRVQMLDDFIRRTGLGIPMNELSNPENHDDNQDAPPVNDKNRVYLGLNVQGKKRADLANGRASRDREEEIPLVWSVCGLLHEGKSEAVLDYLAGHKPLIAYRYYISHVSGDRAEWLRRLDQSGVLAKSLPKWLGWSVNAAGESPLVAAVKSANLEALKRIMKLAPRAVTSTMHDIIPFYGYNLFLVLTLYTDSIEIEKKEELLSLADYLLANKVSPLAVDRDREYNIFHILCGKTDEMSARLMEHLIAKLPNDVVKALVCAQSKRQSDSPLHVAVKQGNLSHVRVIVESTKDSLGQADINGFTPLAAAIHCGYVEIVRLLITISPVDVLFTENAVGQTPLEVAVFKNIVHRSSHTVYRGKSGLTHRQTRHLATYSFEVEETDRLARWTSQLPDLRDALKDLREEGLLEQGDDVSRKLDVFVQKLQTWIDAAAEKTPVSEPAWFQRDTKSDPVETMQVVSAFLKDSSHAPKRHLIHLLDVQRSVAASLQISNAAPKAQEDDEGFAQEDKGEKYVGVLLKDLQTEE